MIRAALLPLLLLSSPLAAQDSSAPLPATPGVSAPADRGSALSPEARKLLGAEIRAVLLAHPDLVARLADGTMAPTAAPLDLYKDDREQDLSALDRARAALTAITPEGFGAGRPRQTITLFVTYPCPDCAMAERGLRALADKLPGLRVEVRAAENTAAARSLRALADDMPPAAFAALRMSFYGTAPEEETADEAEEIGVLASVQEDALLFHKLGLDMAPSYVLPKMMLRGEMPAIVLERYLSK
ncbi:hypothetical protein [Pseudooceanicola nanhaiensis]|uniref:hypothetical protein n=1 Tax=Pseudooceanicola nanhaiensis TaxID=375761 RepID=UPI001CD4191C|nr:hypothetical protein [Pseudooceanicola nanhaiensis]MCA0920969.1 hypothetical protein [Pseudooceanicola nanhaiensis]